MWDDFGQKKSGSYLAYKFNPNHRIGLSNYLRECFISEFIEPEKNDIVLDAGCASGRQLFAMRDKIKEGHGTDIGEGFIIEANAEKKRIGADNLFFHNVEMERLSFPVEFFDKIICAEVLEHVQNKEAGLKELLKVLKKNGTLVITTPNLNSDGTLWGRFLRIMGVRKFSPIKCFTKEELEKHGDCHVREFDRKNLSMWLEWNGLKILNIKSTSFIDGPFIDFIFNPFLHFRLSRKIIIVFEKFLANQKLFFGRNLIVKAIKK